MTPIIEKKGFALLVSCYIGMFAGFYLWTAMNQNIGILEDLRYLFTALFSLSFLPFFLFNIQEKSTMPLIVFILYCTVLMLMHGEFSHAVLYILWLLYAVIILPRLISLNFEIFKNYVANFFFITLVLLLVLFLYSWFLELDAYFGGEHRRRFTSGLSNPGIYSKLVVTALWLNILLYIVSRRKVYLLFIPVFFYLLFLADLRTDLYGAFIGLLAFFFFRDCYRNICLLVVIMLGIIVLMLLVVNYSLSDIDIITSGRIHFWGQLLNDSGFGESLKVMFFGTGKFIGHYDSQWLKTLLMFGIVGLFLYLFAIYYLFLRLNSARKRVLDPVVKDVFVWGIAILIMFVAMGVTTYIFPSLGNSYNLILVPFLIGVINLAKRQNDIAVL